MSNANSAVCVLINNANYPVQVKIATEQGGFDIIHMSPFQRIENVKMDSILEKPNKVYTQIV